MYLNKMSIFQNEVCDRIYTFQLSKKHFLLLNIRISINFHSRFVITVFFLSGFSSQALTIRRAAGEGRGPSFIPLYHFHPLTNIETFICNFACEMTMTYF